MNNSDEFESLNLFDRTDEETEKAETVSGETIDGEDEKSESLDSLFKMLSQMKDSSFGDDDDDDGMDADGYHNKAVKYARSDKYKRAGSLCMEGLKRYPMNVDLLADTIKYSTKVGDMRAANTHYLMLRKIPFCQWNWRAFTFLCDFLMADNPAENEKEIRFLVKQYKSVLSYEEKACMAESELEDVLGNHDQSMKVLADSIQHYSNAPQCALRLADMQFERGLYADVMNTCNYGLAASAEPQPSINIPYLLLRVMAKEHILIAKANQGTVKSSEMNAVRDEYKMLLAEFPGQMMQYARAIEGRRSALRFISQEE